MVSPSETLWKDYRITVISLALHVYCPNFKKVTFSQKIKVNIITAIKLYNHFSPARTISSRRTCSSVWTSKTPWLCRACIFSRSILTSYSILVVYYSQRTNSLPQQPKIGGEGKLQHEWFLLRHNCLWHQWSHIRTLPTCGQNLWRRLAFGLPWRMRPWRTAASRLLLAHKRVRIHTIIQRFWHGLHVSSVSRGLAGQLPHGS
jgi:hypothetical protein